MKAFVDGKPCQPDLIFAGKTKPARVECLLEAHRVGSKLTHRHLQYTPSEIALFSTVMFLLPDSFQSGKGEVGHIFQCYPGYFQLSNFGTKKNIFGY
jgi:hypothetical protein